jgi:hypothetical protein
VEADLSEGKELYAYLQALQGASLSVDVRLKHHMFFRAQSSRDTHLNSN